MKKFFTLVLLLSCSYLIFSQNYKIVDSEYNVTGNFWGTTKVSSLQSNFPLDTKTEFTEEEFESYIDNYEQKIINTRLFVEVEVTYEVINELYDNKNVKVITNVKDSNHLLAVPYPKFDSNNGFTLKIKAKDTNFLGSMNTMNSDLNINIDNGDFMPGFNFSYDYPFTFAGTKLNWVNDYSISYTIGDRIPDFTAKTGVEYIKDYESYSYKLAALQYIRNDNDYNEYDDNFYFTEELSFSTPITMHKLKNYSNLYFTPYITLSYNWDFDGINQENQSLYSPILSFGQSISNSNVNWDGNFREGYSYSISNSYQYNLNNNDFYPLLSFEVQYFYNFNNNNKRFLNKFGIYTNVYGFLNIAHFLDPEINTFKYGESLGSRLRGRRDNDDLGYDGLNTAPMGFAFNFDLPHYMFETNFPNDLFNFEMQVAPFIDVGIYSYEGSRKPAIKDGIYCAGCEVLVFPKKYSSFTVRGSIGMDVMKALKHEDGVKKGILSKSSYEIFIGIGTAY